MHYFIEIVTEFLLLIIYILTLRFSLFESENFTINDAATYIIYLNFSILAIEVTFAIFVSLKSLYYTFKQLYHKHLNKKK